MYNLNKPSDEAKVKAIIKNLKEKGNEAEELLQDYDLIDLRSIALVIGIKVPSVYAKGLLIKKIVLALNQEDNKE